MNQEKMQMEMKKSSRRKRKSENELNILREELRRDFIWSREKIQDLSKRLTMNET
jgi:hypothetical protein